MPPALKDKLYQQCLASSTGKGVCMEQGANYDQAACYKCLHAFSQYTVSAAVIWACGGQGGAGGQPAGVTIHPCSIVGAGETFTTGWSPCDGRMISEDGTIDRTS